jgi:predicted nucleic acid-binding protein
MVPPNEGILLKHRMNSMRSLRGLMREEVDLRKASAFIGKVRREWRVEWEWPVHGRHRSCPVGYLADRLPSRADKVFQKAEDGRAELIVPSITLGETLYTLLNGKEVFGVRIPIEKLSVLYNVVESGGSLKLGDLNMNGWRDVVNVALPVLHDRMIVATHRQSGSKGIITDDQEISDLEGIETIW